MYVIDTYTLHLLFTVACLASITCSALAFTILRGKRVGGLTFCKLGRFGFCFYVTKPTPARTVTNTNQSLPVVEH